jgi:hypothetical protein
VIVSPSSALETLCLGDVRLRLVRIATRIAGGGRSPAGDVVREVIPVVTVVTDGSGRYVHTRRGDANRLGRAGALVWDLVGEIVGQIRRWIVRIRGGRCTHRTRLDVEGGFRQGNVVLCVLI